MRITIIDGQGGRIGGMLIERIRKLQVQAEITAVGTNSVATAAMLKAGADFGATGENPRSSHAGTRILSWARSALCWRTRFWAR